MFWVMKYLTFYALLSAAFSHIGGNIANKYFLEKQKFLLEILLRVEDPLLNVAWIEIGRTLVLNKSDYVHTNNDMLDFYINWKDGELLKPNSFFSPLIPAHFQQSKGLFYYFYNANDWATLRQNICWARQHVNAGMFVYALTAALLKREDFEGLILPKIYELLPQHFLAAPLVHRLQRFDYGTWRETALSQAPNASPTPKDHFGFKPRAQLVNADEKKCIMPPDLANIRNTTAWLQAMEDVDVLWTPAPYSGDSAPLSRERQLSYLTEDVGWNAYWYYLHMGLALTKEVQPAADDGKLRDWWLWNLQQLVARYKLEGYALGLKPRDVATADYAPDLLTWTGAKVRSMAGKTQQLIESGLKQLDSIVQQAISEESFPTSKGGLLKLHNAQHLAQFINEHFSFENLLKKLFNNAELGAELWLNFETALREPRFYLYAERLANAYSALKSHFQPYTRNALTLRGVRFNSVLVGRLSTYWQPADLDVSSLLSNRHFYFETQFLWQKSLQARQQRLQHRAFTMQFNVSSSVPQAAVVRTFLTAPNSASAAASSFYQLDAFATNLAAGHNIVQRSSSAFFGTAPDHISYTELYRHTLLALDDCFRFPLDISTPNCGFPNRLLLPQGRFEGLPVQLVFVATPYAYGKPQRDNFACDFANNILASDDLPVGFPFDRAADWTEHWKWGSWHVKNVKVYHVD